MKVAKGGQETREEISCLQIKKRKPEKRQTQIFDKSPLYPRKPQQEAALST